MFWGHLQISWEQNTAFSWGGFTWVVTCSSDSASRDEVFIRHSPRILLRDFRPVRTHESTIKKKHRYSRNNSPLPAAMAPTSHKSFSTAGLERLASSRPGRSSLFCRLSLHASSIKSYMRCYPCFLKKMPQETLNWEKTPDMVICAC